MPDDGARSVPESITVRVEPDGSVFHAPRATTVLQLYKRLGLLPTEALAIRDGGLLTPDVRLLPGDTVLVRKVTSSG